MCEFPFNVGLAGAASGVGIREGGEFTFVGVCQHQDGATNTPPPPSDEDSVLVSQHKVCSTEIKNNYDSIT